MCLESQVAEVVRIVRPVMMVTMEGEADAKTTSEVTNGLPSTTVVTTFGRFVGDQNVCTLPFKGGDSLRKDGRQVPALLAALRQSEILWRTTIEQARRAKPHNWERWGLQAATRCGA